MATAFRESIKTFMSITGSSELVARQKLTENGGNLNEAVNSYFIEGDANTIHETNVPAPQEDFMEIDETSEIATHRSPFSPAREMMNLFPTLGPDLNSSESHHPETASRIDDVTNTVLENDPEIRDDFSNAYDEYFSLFESSYSQMLSEQNECVSGVIPSHGTRFTPSAPVISSLPDYGIEEEMIRAAIEASKREAEIVQQNDAVPHQRQSQLEDPQNDPMVSLSLTSAEHKNFLHELGYETGPSETRTSEVPEVEKVVTSALSNGRLGGGSSSVQDETQDADEQPLLRHGNRCMNLSSPLGPTQHQRVNNLVDSENHIPSDEWGGISSEEHDEAVMLEATMFGGVSEGAGYRVPYTRRRYTRSGLGRTAGPGSGPYTRSTPRPPSPSLTAQRLIREQQDDEYLASLQADREKELLEQAAREAAMEEERLKEEDARRKLEQEQEIERQLAAKEASLPQEPSSDDKNAVNLLVRMPDGSRRGRRFLRTDKLQHLFDFIDVGRVFKPSTYRLVRPYPRRAFSNEESELSLNEVGLTSKQEALFLELI